MTHLRDLLAQINEDPTYQKAATRQPYDVVSLALLARMQMPVLVNALTALLDVADAAQAYVDDDYGADVTYPDAASAVAALKHSTNLYDALRTALAALKESDEACDSLILPCPDCGATGHSQTPEPQTEWHRYPKGPLAPKPQTGDNA